MENYMKLRTFISMFTLACSFLLLSGGINAAETQAYKPHHHRDLCDCVPIECIKGNVVNWQCVYKELYTQVCCEKDHCGCEKDA